TERAYVHPYRRCWPDRDIQIGWNIRERMFPRDLEGAPFTFFFGYVDARVQADQAVAHLAPRGLVLRGDIDLLEVAQRRFVLALLAHDRRRQERHPRGRAAHQRGVADPLPAEASP